MIRVVLQPGSSRAEVAGLHGSPPRLRLKVHAQPERGKANEALFELLSDLLNTSQSSLIILRGTTSRKKDVLVRGISRETVMGLLESSKK